MYFNETSNKLYTIGLVSGGDIKLYNSTTQIMCQVIAMLVFCGRFEKPQFTHI